MPKCPNDHDSTWEDFCSVCGEAMDASAGQSAESAESGGAQASASEEKNTASQIGLSCPSCSVSRTELDVFCESCGYDFASGTLPPDESAALDPASGSEPTASASTTSASTASTSTASASTAVAAATGAGVGSAAGADGAAAPPASSAPEAASVTGSAGADPDPATPAGAVVTPQTGAAAPPDTVAVVSLDRAFFDRVAGGGELQFPDPEPVEVRVTLVGNEILIGRRSDSRGIYPEVDLSPPMDDPAVSHRHAMLRQASDGSWTVTDLDSTNGSYLGDHTVAMVAGKEKPFPLGTALFVGAYTKVTIESL